jgi:hypothetical protein
MYGRQIAAEALARTWNPEAEPMNESLVVYGVVKILEDLEVTYAIVGGTLPSSGGVRARRWMQTWSSRFLRIGSTP